MSFLPLKPFNPTVTPVPILGPSSGNPKSLQDPNSLASIGSKLQAMTDQANADTLYDAKPSGKKEGFVDLLYLPWIVKSPACKSKDEGFTASLSYRNSIDIVTASCVLVGVALIVASMH